MVAKDSRNEASTTNWVVATEAANRLHSVLQELHEGGRLSHYVKRERFLTAAAAQQQARALAALFDYELGLASFPQMRSLIETSLRLAWMLDPDVDADVRVSRTLTIALAQQRHVDALLGGDEVADLVEAIEGCDVLLGTNRFGEAISVGGVTHPSPGHILAYGSKILPPSENGRSLGEFYGALSSAAHGGAAVARYLLTRPESPTDIHLNAWDIWQATQSQLSPSSRSSWAGPKLSWAPQKPVDAVDEDGSRRCRAAAKPPRRNQVSHPGLDGGS